MAARDVFTTLQNRFPDFLPAWEDEMDQALEALRLKATETLRRDVGEHIAKPELTAQRRSASTWSCRTLLPKNGQLFGPILYNGINI
jgi:hypothetical protein